MGELAAWGGPASQSSRIRPHAQPGDPSTAFALIPGDAPVVTPRPPCLLPHNPAPARLPQQWRLSCLCGVSAGSGSTAPARLMTWLQSPSLIPRPGPCLPPCILISQATGWREEVALLFFLFFFLLGKGECGGEVLRGKEGP